MTLWCCPRFCYYSVHINFAVPVHLFFSFTDTAHSPSPVPFAVVVT